MPLQLGVPLDEDEVEVEVPEVEVDVPEVEVDEEVCVPPVPPVPGPGSITALPPQATITTQVQTSARFIAGEYTLRPNKAAPP